MDSTANILQFCRLCLVKDGVNIPIFDEQGDIRQIYLKISSCLPVKVAREDHLPKKICDGCSNKLDNFYDFWRTSAESEKQLLAWLGATGKDAAQVNVKEEDNFDEPLASDISKNDDDENKCYMFEQKVEEGPPVEINDEPPPSKRPRRTAAVKAAIAMDQNSDDDGDSGEPITKMEDDSDETDGDDREPAFVDVPSTSADDQPGPSGVSKDGSDAPPFGAPILNSIFYENGLSITPVHPDNLIQNGVKNEPLDDPSPQVKRKRKTQPKKLIQNTESEEKLDNEPLIIKAEPLDDPLPIKPPSPSTPVPVKRKKKKESKKSSPNPQNEVHEDLDEPVHCETCDATFKNNVDYALHSIVHNEDGKFSCHLCDYRNLIKYNIKTHMRVHDGSSKYKCEVCGKGFTISTHAAEHKNFHTGEKPFGCEICGKHFMFSWFLTSHRRSAHWEIMTGSPLVKYDCLTCNKHYTSASGLKRHKLSKHNIDGVDQSILCDICGKRLSNKEKLKFHLRIHTGYKPYECQMCGKAFSRREQMKEHERTHTGEKPHVCKFCGKGFTQRTPLVVHERTHTGERPYICSICGKGYVSKGVMDTHKRTCVPQSNTWVDHLLM